MVSTQGQSTDNVVLSEPLFSRQTGRHKLYKQHHSNPGRSRALHLHLRQLAGGHPPGYLPAVHQHRAGQPSHCYVQVKIKR